MTVAIIGTGNMGGGLAGLLAGSGVQVAGSRKSSEH